MLDSFKSGTNCAGVIAGVVQVTEGGLGTGEPGTAITVNGEGL